MDTKNALPAAPGNLCFNKDDFIKDHYDIDKFLTDCRKHASLETLREDLSVYMKILQSALVELINRDYADFVNLSSNLAGVDKIIGSISEPLRKFHGDVETLRTGLQDTIADTQLKLTQRSKIREQKAALQRLEGIFVCLDAMESILSLNGSQPRTGVPLEAHLVERVSTEFNRVQFYVAKSTGLVLMDAIYPRLQRITQVLMESLEAMFTEGLDVGNEELLTRCLRTYIAIDKVADAELLFRQIVVRPYMNGCISEAYMTSSAGSQRMYEEILKFQTHKMSVIKAVLKPSSGREPIVGFDFFVNSVWPEVADDLDSRTPSIFAPGNPDKFHAEYSRAMEFVCQFERQCERASSIKRLRNHPSYISFMSKWSLPVYFQIRLQEIAGSVERCLDNPWVSNTINPDQPRQLKLQLSLCVLSAVQRCFAVDVFLRSLTHRFWKLALQIVSRYITWLRALVNGQVLIAVAVDKQSIKPVGNRIDTIKHDEGRISPARSESPAGLQETRKPSVEELLNVVGDASQLNLMILHFFDESIAPLLALSENRSELLRASLGESMREIETNLGALCVIVREELSSQAGIHLRLVSDIPRLYRRMNREVPNKPSGYVSSCMDVLVSFRDKYQNDIPSSFLTNILQEVVLTVAQQYEETTCDVLLSVKKMEDSLRRLKRAKASNPNVGVSDDHKIRLQIHLDVLAFASGITLLGIDRIKVDPICRLEIAATEALKNQDGGPET